MFAYEWDLFCLVFFLKLIWSKKEMTFSIKTTSVDQDQTAPTITVWSGSTLFARETLQMDLHRLKDSIAIKTNSVDQDQTAPMITVWSRSTLFATEKLQMNLQRLNDFIAEMHLKFTSAGVIYCRHVNAYANG